MSAAPIPHKKGRLWRPRCQMVVLQRDLDQIEALLPLRRHDLSTGEGAGASRMIGFGIDHDSFVHLL